jgi:hypothetical protein
MQTSRATGDWAASEFSSAALGNSARTQRLVLMAAAAATVPAGTICEVFRDDLAGREGAYRLLEKHGGRHDAVGAAAARASFQRAQARHVESVIVPIDGSSLTATVQEPEQFGPVGNSGTPAIGMTVMGAIALSPSGTPIGVAAQSYWARPHELRSKNRWDRRSTPFEDKETVRWLEVMEKVLEAKADAGFEGNVWFQADRGADFAHCLAWASTAPCWVTVRASRDRHVEDRHHRLLWHALQGQPCSARYSLHVPRGEQRQERDALMELRHRSVVVTLPRQVGLDNVAVEIFAVLVSEVTRPPNSEEPIEWLLLTTKPVHGPKGAREVVRAYGFRWRIEESHRTWKSVTGVERNQLRTAGAFCLWSRILYSVSLRAERLKRLARETPLAAASTEFTKHELEVLRLRFKKSHAEQETLSLKAAVQLVAQLGGYTGKSSGGPPGTVTIHRGLDFLQSSTWVLEALAGGKKK